MTDQEYKRVFSAYQWEDLRQLWPILKAGDPLNNGMEKGKAFEYFIMRLFELDEAAVEYAYEVQDNHPRSNNKPLEQIDGLFYFEQYIGLVECKNWQDPVSGGTLATLRNQLMRRPSSMIGNIFSISGFTEPAITLATHMYPQTVLLWNKQDIQFVIDNDSIVNGFVTKYRQYAMRCIPDYRLK